MGKSKSILFSGNPFVEMRETKGDKCNLRLVYVLGRLVEYDERGEKKTTQQRKSEKLNLWLWNKKHLTPAESEHNRQTKEMAKAVREMREKEYLNKTKGYVFASDRNKINFYEWFEDYISNYQKSDVRVLKFALNRFRQFVSSNKKYAIFADILHPDQMTPEMITDFVAELERVSKGTGAQSAYKRFKKVVTVATRKHIFVENPCDGISAHVNDDDRLRKEVLTAEEISKLIQCKFDRQSDDVRRAFIFCLFTGLRFCDVKALTYGNIDYDTRTVTFQQSKTGRKNTVPLREDIIALIGRGDESQLIFKLGSANGCNKAVRNWVERAGINKHITWHCARHTFGANTYYNVKDLRATSELLGHADTTITQIYTQVFDERKREIINSLPSIDQ